VVREIKVSKDPQHLQGLAVTKVQSETKVSRDQQDRWDLPQMVVTKEKRDHRHKVRKDLKVVLKKGQKD
jgi:hypothetical protein